MRGVCGRWDEQHCGKGLRVSPVTPKFLSRGVLTEVTCPYWLLSPGGPHYWRTLPAPTQESKVGGFIQEQMELKVA